VIFECGIWDKSSIDQTESRPFVAVRTKLVLLFLKKMGWGMTGDMKTLSRMAQNINPFCEPFI